jgi:hypothetical protein
MAEIGATRCEEPTDYAPAGDGFEIELDNSEI